MLEVRGAPCGGEEALLLYLENERRSGGGPVRSCQRIGGRLYVTFSSNGGEGTGGNGEMGGGVGGSGGNGGGCGG